MLGGILYFPGGKEKMENEKMMREQRRSKLMRGQMKWRLMPEIQKEKNEFEDNLFYM